MEADDIPTATNTPSKLNRGGFAALSGMDVTGALA
jgi:hypothetical protein